MSYAPILPIVRLHLKKTKKQTKNFGVDYAHALVFVIPQELHPVKSCDRSWHVSDVSKLQ